MRSSKEIKSNAKLILKQNLRSILLISLGYIAVSYILSLLYSELSGLNAYMEQYVEVMNGYLETGELGEITVPQVKTSASVLAALIFLASVVIGGGYKGYHLLRARGESAGFMDIIPKGRFMIRIVCIEVVSGLVVLLGSVAFIVPGIILELAYSQAVYIMFDHPEMSAFECLRTSRKMMRGNKKRLFKLNLSFLGWLVLADLISSLLFPVLDIWLDPYMGISTASFYNELVASENI